jgi:hypothetical protein
METKKGIRANGQEVLNLQGFDPTLPFINILLVVDPNSGVTTIRVSIIHGLEFENQTYTDKSEFICTMLQDYDLLGESQGNGCHHNPYVESIFRFILCTFMDNQDSYDTISLYNITSI